MSINGGCYDHRRQAIGKVNHAKRIKHVRTYFVTHDNKTAIKVLSVAREGDLSLI